MNRLLTKALVVFGITLLALTGGLAVSAEANWTYSGDGYMEASTFSTYTCIWGRCGHGKTYNRDYSPPYPYKNAYALQTASSAWNTDGGTHCVDYLSSPMAYGTHYNRSPDVAAWDSSTPVPTHWVSSWHYDKAQSWLSSVESYTSSDGNHSSSYWVFHPSC